MRFGGIFDYATKHERLTVVNAELEDPAVWNDSKRAQELGKEKKLLDSTIDMLEHVKQHQSDTAELFEMAQMEDDIETIVVLESDIQALEAEIAKAEFRRMFSNPMDPNPCFIDIQAGAGGTEACDWASMLLRQYVRYCERKNFKVEILDKDCLGNLFGDYFF